MKANGGPAFPPSFGVETHGMSLRDYFATHAPRSVSVNGSEHVRRLIGMAEGAETSSDDWIKAEALLRYQYADEMLEAREK